MKYLLPLAALVAATIGSPAMAQSFEKQEGRADAAVHQMQAMATRLQSETTGASAEQMRGHFNKPAARHCKDCPDCPHKDCADCPEHQASNGGECPECAEHGEGLCKEKEHG